MTDSCDTILLVFYLVKYLIGIFTIGCKQMSSLSKYIFHSMTFLLVNSMIWAAPPAGPKHCYTQICYFFRFEDSHYIIIIVIVSIIIIIKHT